MTVERVRSSGRPGLRTVGALIVGGLIVAACGSGSGSDPESSAPSAQRLMVGAAQRMFTAGTAQIDYAVAGLDDAVSGSGLIDFASGQSSTVTQGVATGATQVVVDGDRTFLQVAGVTPPDGFVASDPSDADQADSLGVINQLLLVLQPIQVLQLLGGATDVDDLGTVRAGGVDTTHVHATIDLAAALDALDGRARRAVEQVLAGLDTDTVTVDVFVDEDGRVRKFEAEFELNDGTRVTVTQRYSRFGDPVDIEIPEAEDAIAAAAAFGIANADVSGTWTVTTTRLESSDPVIAPIGEVITETVEIACDDAGVCGYAGYPWEPLGGGRFAYDLPVVSDCITGTATVEVAAADDGRATELYGTQVNQFSCAGRAFTDTVEHVFSR